MPEQHQTKVHRVRRGHETWTWIARCSCGWESRPHHREEAAENDASDHVVVITRDDN